MKGTSSPGIRFGSTGCPAGCQIRNTGNDVTRKAYPERTCVGCGRKAPKKQLLRFLVREDGTLQFDPRGVRPGRGGYLCPRSSCFFQAAKRRRIAIRCRREVTIDSKGWMEAAYRELTAEMQRHAGFPVEDAVSEQRFFAHRQGGKSPRHLESLREMVLSLFPGGGSEWPR